MRDFKCDYCDIEIKGQETVPEEWLACRIREKEQETDGISTYVMGPTACPFHVSQLRMV